MNERITPPGLLPTLVLAVALMMGLSGCELLPTEAEHQLSIQTEDATLPPHEETVIDIAELHLHYTRDEVEESLATLASEGILFPFLFDEEEGVWTYDYLVLADEYDAGLGKFSDRDYSYAVCREDFATVFTIALSARH
jgi:hypothetical protein